MDKINDTKNALFFRELQCITVCLLICDSYMSWSWNTRSVSLKNCVGFSIFNSVSFLLNFIFFVEQNAWPLSLWNVIIPFKIKVLEKPHTVLLLDLIFKLQQEVLKFSDICLSSSSPKIDLVKSFWNLENWSFENLTM